MYSTGLTVQQILEGHPYTPKPLPKKLHICVNCSALYWAQRVTSRFCSERCESLSRAKRNREYNRIRARKYYWEHHEEQLAAARKRYDREASRIILLNWRHRNPEQAKLNARLRDYRRRNAPGRHSLKDWLWVKEMFGSACAMCCRTDLPLTEDHKIPISKGGTNYIDNIQPLCLSCNARKGNKIWFASCPVDKSLSTENMGLIC